MRTWILVIFFCAAAALAVVCSTLIETELSVLPEVAALPPATIPRSAPLDAGRIADRLGLKERERPKVKRPPLDARVLGTLVSPRSEDSIALLELTGRKPTTVKTGDAFADGQIVRIERGAVVIERDDVEERLVGHAVVSTSAPVQPTAPRSWTVSRAAVEAQLSDIETLMRTVRFVPAFVDGRAVGFRLVHASRDSMLLTLGLEPGDIVRSVGGFDLTAPNSMGAYAKVMNAKELDVEVERRGQRLVHHYQLN